jgi:hypothetical protein
VQSTALRELSARRGGAEAGAQFRVCPLSDVVRDADYHDPLAERETDAYDGPWLAGVAPVGGTSFVAIVGTRLDAAVALDRRTRRLLAAWAAGGALLVAASMLAVLRETRRRSRSA